MKNKELVSFVKRCISEVIVEPSTEEWAVQYHIRGKNNIPFTKHNSKSDAQTAAKKFIDSIHNSISKSEGNIIQKSENMYILIRNEGGTLGMAAWNKVTPGFVDKMNSQLDAPLKENASLVLTPTGQSDDWSRPVYKDQNGRIYVDINLGNGTPAIHSTSDEGEPEFPVRNFTISKATSSAPKRNRLCPRCGNSKPELMKKTPEGKMSCTFCHWEENPSEPYTAGTIKEAKLRCTICGGHAKGKQWWNQDKGQGICAKCARDMKARGQEDIGQSYGKEGTHYHVDESSWNNSEPTQYREYTHDGEIWYAHFNPNKHTEIPGMVILPYTRTHLPDGKKQSEFLAVHNKNDFNSLLIKWNTQQPSKWHYSPGHMNEEAQPEPYDDKTDTFQPSPRDRIEPVKKPTPVKGGGKDVKINEMIREDKLSTSERNKIGQAFAKVGLDGNGRFEKKEHGLAAVTQALSQLGFQLDMVSADMIMGDKGSRNLVFRRANDAGADPYTEKATISNSRIAFNWERMDGPTHQYPTSPSKFEILAYAS